VAIDKLRQDRTTFIIAHRLSTVRDANTVIFLDGGRVAEMGSYDELSRLGGRFASLLRTSGLLDDSDDEDASKKDKKPEATPNPA
jgi:ATP-binding cassette subfamily B protein